MSDYCFNLTVPTPPKFAAPNKQVQAKSARIALSREKSENKRTCAFIAKQSGITFPGTKPIQVRITYFHKDRRSFGDVDNLIARAKSTLDGICLGLGIDDSRFAGIEVDQRTDKQNPRLIVNLWEVDHE